MKELLIPVLLLACSLRAEIPQFSTIAEALRQPQFEFFWIERRGGSDRFSVSYRQGAAIFKNSCAHPVTFQAGKASALSVAPGATATQPVGR